MGRKILRKCEIDESVNNWQHLLSSYLTIVREGGVTENQRCPRPSVTEQSMLSYNHLLFTLSYRIEHSMNLYILPRKVNQLFGDGCVVPVGGTSDRALVPVVLVGLRTLFPPKTSYFLLLRNNVEQEKFQKNRRSPVKSGDLATLIPGYPVEL
ncbi:hypothetical protein evm_000416 [Chilo suppressalis]|nr:hypothetical protein evm_000416 [Chilo suppressalis]